MASWYDAPMDALSGWQDKLNTFLEPQEMTPEEYREWLKKKKYNFMYNTYKETYPLTKKTFGAPSYPDDILRIQAERNLNQFQNPLTAGYEKPTPSDIWGEASRMAGPDQEVSAMVKPADKYFKEMDRMFLSSMLGSAFGGKKKQVSGAPPPPKNQPKPGAFKLVAPSPMTKKQNPYEWTL